MKNKHHGMVAVISGIIALAAVGGYAASGIWRSNEVIRRLPPLPALQLKVPTEQQVRQMEDLYTRLDQLAAPSARSVAGQALTLFGYRGPAASDSDSGDGDGDHKRLAIRQLSLIVLAGINSYCIIDGQFMPEGATMDDGTQVLKIESHRVLVATKYDQRWLYLEDEQPPSADGSHLSTLKQGKGQS